MINILMVFDMMISVWVALVILALFIVIGVSFGIVKKRQKTGSNFSIESITDRLSLLVKRFPITTLLVIGFATLFFIAVNDEFDIIPYQLWIFFFSGILLSSSITLLLEDYFVALKRYIATLVAVLLWGVYCYFLPKDSDVMLTGKAIELFVLSGSFFLSIFFIPFFKRDTDAAYWNFSREVLLNLALASFFGIIFFCGLGIALLAVDSLFSISIPDKTYANLAVFCFALFAPLYFLANIPSKTEKFRSELYYTKAQKVLALYILTPILAVYAIILYAYLFKIIATWELPNGWVSWLVSALALGGLLVITVLYPIHQQENNKVVNFIYRWFGLLILPLLVLMSIGISRRIGDYGITINRGYILLLNIWFYGIYSYLFFTQMRHVKWILISPVIIAFITSINIWGVASFSKRSLTKELRTVLPKQLSFEDARSLFSEMKQEDVRRVESTLDYLQRNFGKESVQPFFTDTVEGRYWSSLSNLGEDFTFVGNEKNQRIDYYAQEQEVWRLDNCYNTFMPIYYVNYERSEELVDYSFRNDTIIVSTANNTFAIPIKEVALKLLSTNVDLRNKQELIVKQDDFSLVINSLYGNYFPEKDSLFISDLNGYLFYNSDKKAVEH